MYTIKHNGSVVTETAWEPMAQAAWHRATRDQNAGGVVELLIDGRGVSTYSITGGRGARWPQGQECGLQEVIKAMLQLLREDDWNTREIAEAMTAYGLPTSRARVDAMRGSAGRSIELSSAEVVVLIHAVINKYKKPAQNITAQP